MKTDFTKLTGIGKETKRAIQEDIRDLIHPWQYKDSEIHIVNVDSDITDVETNWNQEMRFRYGFSINDDKSLNLPTMFVQINGIYDNKAEYRKFIEKMVTGNTIRYKETQNLFQHFKNRIDLEEAKKLCETNNVPAFKNVNSSMKKMLHKKLAEFIEKYENIAEEEVLTSVLTDIIFYEDTQISSALQNFDYCFKNPKIIVENMDDSSFSNHAKYTLIFLYTLGFDILIFSPKGSEFLKDYELNTITLEKYLNPTEEKYDYRDDEEIKKELKEKKKKEKIEMKQRTSWERKRKRKEFFAFSAVCIGAIAIIVLFIVVLIQDTTQSSDFKKLTEGMSWDMEPVVMYVNSDDVVAYSYASEEAEQSCLLEKDEEVKVTGINDTWVQISVSSGSAYVLKENVRTEMYDIELEHFMMKIKIAEPLNAYAFPDVESEVVHTYKAEDKILALAFNSDWYQVEHSGDTAFVSRDELKVYEEPEEEVKDVETEEDESEVNTEEMTDGEIIEEDKDVGAVIVVLSIILFFTLVAIFFGIMSI